MNSYIAEQLKPQIHAVFRGGGWAERFRTTDEFAKQRLELEGRPTYEEFFDTTSKVVINGGNITAGRVKSKNDYSWIDLDTGQFNFGNGGISWTGSQLVIGSNNNLKTEIDKGVTAATTLGTNKTKWDTGATNASNVKATVDTNKSIWDTVTGKATPAQAQGYATTAETNAKAHADAEALKVKTDLGKDITGVSTSINNLDTEIKGTFKDGVIQESEAVSIQSYLNVVSVEKDNVDKRYTSIYANANLAGTPKTNLLSAKNAYNTAHTNLVNYINTAISDKKVTAAEKTTVDARFASYKTALSTLSTRFEEALNAISTDKASKAEASAKTHADAVAIAEANLVEIEAKAYADGKVTAEEAARIADANAKLADAKAHANTQASGAEASAKAHAEQQVNDLEIGGRNLLMGAMEPISSSSYNIKDYELTEDIPDGAQVTLSMKAKLGTGKKYFGIYNSGGNVSPTQMYPSSKGDDGVFRITFNWVVGASSNKYLRVYHMDISTTATSEIEWIQLEYGSKATSPKEAPEDTLSKIYMPVRYIRDWQNGSTANAGNHWYEIEVYANGENIARGKSATISSGTGEARVTDGNRSGSYASGTSGAKVSIQVDLGEIYYNVDSVGIWHYHNDNRTYHETKTEVSADGITWYTIFDSAIEGQYAATADGKIFPNTWARHESLTAPKKIAEDSTDAKTKTDAWSYQGTTKFDGKSIETGTLLANQITSGILKSQNEVSRINMNDGTFNFGNGGLVWNGQQLVIGTNNNLKADIDQGVAAANTLDTNKTKWDKADNFNTDGTLAPTKISGTIPDNKIGNATKWNTASTNASSVKTTVDSKEKTWDTVTSKATPAQAEAYASTAETNAKKYADEAVDDIEVGVRNLFRNSNFSQGTSTWSINGNVSLQKTDGRNAMLLKSGSGGFYTQPQNLEVGIKYTVSFLAKSNSSSTTSAVYFGFLNQSGGKSTTKTVGSSWEKVEYTTSANLASGGSLFHFYGAGNTGTHGIFITDIKLEKGNKATDWTPAPEDVEASIGDVDEKATNANASISDMMSDLKITPIEKTELARSWERIKAEYTQLNSQASTLGVASATRTNYTTAYNALNTTAPRIQTDILASMTTNYNLTTTTRNTFKAQMSAYFVQAETISKAITDKIQSNASSAASTASTANTAAGNAQSTANAAKSTLDSKEGTWDAKETTEGAKAKADAAAKAAEENAKKYVDDNTGNLVNNPAATGNHTGWSASGLSSLNQTFEGVSARVLQSSIGSDTQNYSSYFKVDPSKAYEVSAWFKKSIANASGYYFGLNGIDASGSSVGFVQTSQTGGVANANNTNFYFTSGTGPTDWVKIVGYIMPVGTTPSDLNGVGTASNAIMKQNIDRIRLRFLNWSNAGTVRQLWVANPKVVEVDPNAVMYGAMAKTKTDAWSYQGTTKFDGKSIETGTLLANQITSGILKSQNDVSQINLNDGTFNFGSGALVYSGGTLTVKGSINADHINSGTLNIGRIPDLAATKITTGTLNTARVPDLAATKITSGEFATARIPNLSAGKITTGSMHGDRITAGTLNVNRLNATTLSAITANLGTVTAGTIRSRDNAIDINLDTGTINLSRPLTVNHLPVSTKKEVEDAIQNIEIGGRNYAFNTGEILSNTTSNVRIRTEVNFDALKGLEGQEITYSFEAKSTVAGMAQVYILDMTNYQTLGYHVSSLNVGPIGLDWGSFEVTAKVNTDITLSNISEFTLAHNASTSHTVEVRSLKIEKGNIATDWTEAPEDTQANIDEKTDIETTNAINNQLGDFVTKAVNDDTLGKITSSLNDYLALAEQTKNSVNGLVDDDGNLILGADGEPIQGGIATEIEKLFERAVGIENNLGEFTESWNFDVSQITMGEEGLFVGTEGSDMGILIAPDRVVDGEPIPAGIYFMDGGSTIAFISGQMMQINRGIFVQSAQIGEHVIETIAGGHTIFSWIPK